jgi:hypothetical protein
LAPFGLLGEGSGTALAPDLAPRELLPPRRTSRVRTSVASTAPHRSRAEDLILALGTRWFRVGCRARARQPRCGGWRYKVGAVKPKGYSQARGALVYDSHLFIGWVVVPERGAAGSVITNTLKCLCRVDALQQLPPSRARTPARSPTTTGSSRCVWGRMTAARPGGSPFRARRIRD